MELHTSTPNTLHTMKKQDLAFTYKKAFVSRGLEFINLQPYHQNLDEINQIGDSTSLHLKAVSLQNHRF